MSEFWFETRSEPAFQRLETNPRNSPNRARGRVLRFASSAQRPRQARILGRLRRVAKHYRLCGGEGGIRTLGTGYPVRQISNLLPACEH